MVWPNPWELLYYGEKGVLAEALDRASSEATSSCRPRISRLDPNTNFESLASSVLKRGYSGYSEDVHLPNSADRPDSWDSLTGGEIGHPLYNGAWLAQPYQPAIRQIGEFRVYFVAGKQVHTVHTRPGEDGALHIDLVHTMYPLDIWR